MTVLTKRAVEVFAPATASGQLRGADMAESMIWGTEIERGMEGAAAGRVDQATWLGLFAISGTRAGQPAIVYGPDTGTHTDPVTGIVVANVGEYYWSTSPAGWRRAGNLQRTLVHALNTSAGTANAIQATSDVQFSQTPYAALITVNFVAANTGAMTIAINGETPRPLVLNTGSPIPAAYVTTGMAALVQLDSAGRYRLFSYGDASAIQAAVEAILAEFRTQYLGAYSSNPTTDPASGALQQGAFYWNTASKAWFYWDGDSWEGFPLVAPADGAVTNQKLANGAVTIGKWSTTLYDPTNNNSTIGTNLFTNHVYDKSATLTGRNNLIWGKDILSTATNNATTHTIALGYLTLQDAKDIYGGTFIGFRSGSKLDGSVTPSQYVTGLGIDTFSFTAYANASTAVGGHCGTYKDNVTLSFFGGAFVGYNKGTVSKSVAIGYLTGGTQTSDPNIVYSYDECVLIGWMTGQFMKGNGNTIVGSNGAGGSPVTGAGNSGLGQNVFSSLTSGNNNTAVGTNAGPASGSYSNTTSIGFGATALADNHIVLGNSAVTSLRCQQTSITALSDSWFKDKAGKDGRLPFDALGFINGVIIRWFTWNGREDTRKTDLPEAGIFAQELDALQQRFSVDLGLVDKRNPNRLEATPGKLLFPLIEAVQQLSAANDNIRLTQESFDRQMAVANDNFETIFGRLDGHDQRIADLEAANAALKSEIASLKAA